MTTRSARVLASYGALLLIAVCVSTAARAPHVAGLGLRGAGSTVRATAEAAFLLLFAGMTAGLIRSVLRARRRRRHDDDELPLSQLMPISRTSRMLAILTALLVVAAGIGAAIALAHLQHATTAHQPVLIGPGRSSSPARAGVTVGGHPASSGTLAAIAVGAALLLVAAGYGVWLWLRARRDSGPLIPDEDAAPGAESRLLSGALDRAARALAAGDTPRAAIIASYRAMQRHLAERGTATAPADSPEELLRHASAAGLTLPAEAARLTELFGEARFSTHPMSAAQQQEATTALDRLRGVAGARR